MPSPETSGTQSDPPGASDQLDSSLPRPASALNRLSAQSQLGLPEHAVLTLGWLSCVTLGWLPLLLAVVLLGLIAISTGASYALLRIGAFAETDRRFLRWCVLGLVTALAVIGGALLRRIFRPKGSRERVLGPSGRALRVLLRKPSEKPQGVLSHIPDATGLLLVTVAIVGVRIWFLRRPAASAGSVALIVANLTLWMFYWSLGVLLVGGKLAWGLHKLARAGRYAAGFISALLLVAGGSLLAAWILLIQKASDAAAASLDNTEVTETVSSSSPPFVPRVLLFSLAESFWPERATEAGVHHLIAPLLVRTATVAPEELALLRWDGLARFAQYGGFVSADEAAPPAFHLCIEKLYPGQVSRVKRLPSFRQFRLDDDSEHDVLLGAVLQICENHALRKPYDDLVQVLERAAVNAAIDTKRRNRRMVLSDDESGYFDRCPNPYEAPDRRLTVEQELARVKWGELRPIQKAIIIEKAVLELDDDEIAAHHSPMTKDQVKDAYQNSIRKIRTKLVATCPADRL